MARPEHVHVPFGRGVDSKTGEFLVEPPFLLSGSNIDLSRPGEIAKAHGFAAVTATGLTEGAVPLALGSHRGARLTLTDIGLFSYRGATDTHRLTSPVGWPYPCAPSLTPIIRPTTQTIRCDSAMIGNFVCVAWDNNTDIFVVVMDATTLQVTLAETRPFAAVGNAVGPRVLVMGTTFVVLGWTGSRHRAVTITLGTTISPAVDVSGLNTNASYDAVVNNDGDRIHILTSDAATNDVRLFRVALPLAQDATATFVGINGSFADAIVHHDDGLLFLAFAAGAARLRMATIDNAYAAPSAIINMDALTGLAVRSVTLVQANPNGALGFTGVWAVWEEDRDEAPRINDSTLASYTNLAGVAGDMNKVRWQGLSTVPAAVGVAQEVPHMGLAAKGFRLTTAVATRPTQACFVAAYRYRGATQLPDGTPMAGSLQACLYVMSIPQDAPAANATARVSVVARVNQDRAVYSHPFLPGVFARTTTLFRFPCISRPRPVASNVDRSLDGVDICDLNFAPTAMARGERSNAALFGGGMLSSYDGIRPIESSLHVYPERPYYIDGGAVASGVDNVEHRYVVVWEWSDGGGNLHRSAQSPDLTVPALGANRQIDIHFSAIGAYTERTGIDAPAMIAAVYRTSPVDGLFHRVVSGVPAASAVIGFVFLSDIATDADAANNEALYTGGGILDADPTPHVDLMTFSKDRLWIASGSTVWYSKPLETLIAPEFSAEQVIDVIAGPVTGLVALDDRVLVFTARAIYAIEGQGPDATGLPATGTFSVPMPIASDVGCVSPGSVVVYQEGVFFQSEVGLHRIDRSLNVTYFGAAAERLLAGATVRRAVLHPARNEIRFLVPANSNLVVYDYFTQSWYTRTNLATAVDAIEIDGRFHWIRSDRRGRIERLDSDTAPYADVNATDALIYIPSTFELAWLKFESLQGFVLYHQALLLGRRMGAHALTVDARYDYESTYTTTWPVTDVQLTAIRYRTNDTAATREQLAFNIPRTKAQSIAFRVADAQAAGGAPSQGFVFSGLEMVYTRLRRAHPLVAGARF